MVLAAWAMTVDPRATRHVVSAAPVQRAELDSGAHAQAPDELPAGRGKQILEESCTSCHDLDEVTKFRGYYTRDEWRDIVRTMIEYGAKVDAKDVEVLVAYLDEHLGKK